MLKFTKKEIEPWVSQVHKEFSNRLYDGYAYRDFRFPLEKCPGAVLAVSAEDNGCTTCPEIRLKAGVTFNGKIVTSKRELGFNKQLIKDTLWSSLAQFAEVYNALERGLNHELFHSGSDMDDMIRLARVKKALIEHITAAHSEKKSITNNLDR